MTPTGLAFRKLLQQLATELTSRDLRGMRFLCRDVLSAAEIEGATSTLRLFAALQDHALLLPGDVSILCELLTAVGRLDQLRRVRQWPDCTEGAQRAHFTPYRHLLERICEDTTSHDLERMRFMSEAVGLPSAALSHVGDTEDLFVALERADLLHRQKLDTLLSLMQAIQRANLCREVLALQDSCRSQPSLDNKADQVLPSTGSGDQASVAPLETRSTTTDASPHYKMDARPRGICLIMNNQNFVVDASHNLRDRIGSEVDCARLVYIFEKLHFAVTVRADLTGVEMLSVARHFAADTDHRRYDCFVCCILTHGAAGKLYGVDGAAVDIDVVTSMFFARGCPSLAGKPKLFFIQACQGQSLHFGYPLDTDTASADTVASSSADSAMVPASMADSAPASAATIDLETDDKWATALGRTIPNDADFLLSYATIAGFVSFRSRQAGSWYVQQLVEALDHRCDGDSLVDILVKVNDAVCSLSYCTPRGTFKQSPAQIICLRKKIFFS